MAFDRITVRMLPDGSVSKLFPFHISMEGIENAVLCHDDEDYDSYIKNIFVCAWRKNVIVVMYVAVSNHGHISVLAKSLEDALEYGEEVKKIYSMYFSRKYGKQKVLLRSSVNVQYLGDVWYVRNALAYIVRNAIDNLCPVNEYRWSGYRGVFRGEASLENCRKVSSLTRREKEDLFHTHEDLSKVPWLINEKGELEPASCCDTRYLEEAFKKDQAFFLKVIGQQNLADMEYKLVSGPRTMLPDGEMLKKAEELSVSWFEKNLQELSHERKIRLISFIYRTMHTTAAQLARVFSMDRDAVERILQQLKSKEK